MKHIFEKGKDGHPVLILLHGTGGDETSLIQVANILDPEATYLGIKGEVNENGMNRYFKRLSEGNYDEEDLNKRGQELMTFIKDSSEKYEFDFNDLVLVGFSNGSNIGINLLLQDDSPIKKAILMAPLYPVDTSHLTQTKDDVEVFLSMGTDDPLCPVEGSKDVIALFKNKGAKVEEFWTYTHEVTLAILNTAKEWLTR